MGQTLLPPGMMPGAMPQGVGLPPQASVSSAAQQHPLPAGPAGGLLAPGPLASDVNSRGPGPLPAIPGLVPGGMRPTGLQLGSEEVLAFLLPPKGDESPEDDDDALPAGLRKYAAGLRPALRPEGAGWQQEIVFERLGKTDSEIQSVARFYFEAARNYDNYLSKERITASQYYAGMSDTAAVEGRSNMVMTVVRDTIRSTLPSLLRLFTGVEDPVRFEPLSADITGDDQLSTMLSRQATDYCRWALFTANNGWQILHDALLDALTRKAGWVRWSWGSKREVRTEVCEGLLLPQLQMLLAEPGIEAHRIVRRPMLDEEQKAVMKTPEGQMYLSSGAPAEYWSATITRSAVRSWPQVEQVPAECVWVVADAGSVEGARAVFHVRDVTVSELIEAGLPEAKVIHHTETMIRTRQRQEIIARDSAQGHNLRGAPPGDRSMSLVRYAEGWIRCDADGDNRSELLHVHMLGNAETLVRWERVDECPLACFTPYREPGRIVGLSQADMVMDLQRTESRVMRAVLDSLAQSMFPRTVMVQGQVNQADVRQTAIGAIIRVAQQGAVQELTKPFSGKEALPVMEVLESIRESRTGITRASSGLTIDELQSTAPIAVSQQASAAQDRLDMVARTLAETGLAPLYSGLLRMMARQQDRPNVIRIRGAWVAIDPRALATIWETRVNVGGKGMPQERLQMLAQIAAKQEQIMQQGGMDNPLAGPVEYRNTLARMLETVNISDVSSYFKQLPPGFQPPPAQQPPNTDLILAQVSAQKNASDVENNRASEQTKRAQLLLEDDRERDRAALDAWTKSWVAAAQYGTPAPSLDEFKAAMKSQAPAIGMISDLPAPTSPQPPALGQPPAQQQPPARPGMPPMAGPAGPRPPPAAAPPGGPPSPAPDAATAGAVRSALMRGGPPSAYGQIAQRAMGSPLLGPGGPQIPAPSGGP